MKYRKIRLVVFFILLTAMFSLVAYNEAHSQEQGIRLSGTFGVASDKHISAKYTGVLNAGYEYNGFGIMYDQRHSIDIKGAWFGANAGYAIYSDGFTIRPYVGCWYKSVGNRNGQDRYIHDGQTQILADNLEVNKTYWGGGVQFGIGKFIIEAGYYGIYSITVGMGGLLKLK